MACWTLRRTTISWRASSSITSTRRPRYGKRFPACRRWERKEGDVPDQGVRGDLPRGRRSGRRGRRRRGGEPADSGARIRYPVIKAVRVEGGFGLESFRDYSCSAFLIDAAVPGKYGGTGHTLDWEALERTFGGPFVRVGRGGSGRPWLLAGGLTPGNACGGGGKGGPLQ